MNNQTFLEINHLLYLYKNISVGELSHFEIFNLVTRGGEEMFGDLSLQSSTSSSLKQSSFYNQRAGMKETLPDFPMFQNAHQRFMS